MSGNAIVGVTLSSVLWAGRAGAEDALVMHLRYRRADPKRGADQWQVVREKARWDPGRMAVIVVDMWDKHWCAGASARVDEMAPSMNRVLSRIRDRGALIIHAPSDTMAAYADTPQRRLAQEAPTVEPPAELATWQGLDPAKEPPLPIDDSDNGCDDEPQCEIHQAWTAEHPWIEVAPEDAITDSGPEVYNLLSERGIRDVLVVGVHTNMCVLGRPFGIRRLVGSGLNVVLVRDLTDTMYNSRMAPHVSHFRGTELVIEHIEKHWCPTITSADLTGEPRFRFRGNEEE